MKKFLAIILLSAALLTACEKTNAQTNAAVNTNVGLGPYGGIFMSQTRGIPYGDRFTAYGVTDPYFLRNDSSLNTFIGISNYTYIKFDTNGLTMAYGGNTTTVTALNNSFLDSVNYENVTSATPRLTLYRGTNVIDTIGGANNTADTLVMPNNPRNGDVVLISFNGQYAGGVFVNVSGNTVTQAVVNNKVTSGNAGTVISYIWTGGKSAWCKWAGNK